MDTLTIITLIFDILIGITLCIFSFNLLGWVYRQHPITKMIAKYKGDTEKAEELRQQALKMKLEEDIFSTKKKERLTDKIYIFFAETNIKRFFPLLSISDIMNISILLLAIVFVFISFFLTILEGFVSVVLIIFLVKVIGDYEIYRNRMKIESQMYDFINTCATASCVAPNIVDVFGNIYDKIEAPLSGYLQDCYVEAKQTHDNSLALRHLREKSDSFMFQTCIDAFSTASEMNEGYQAVLRFLRPIVGSNDELVTDMKASIRNTKTTLVIMFCIAGLIFLAVSFGVNGARETLLYTPQGRIIFALLGAIIILGITMHPKE